MPPSIEVRKVPSHTVGDASGPATLIDDGLMAADGVVADLGRAEGKGCVDDYARTIRDRVRDVLMERAGRTEEEVSDPDRVVVRHGRRHQPGRDAPVGGGRAGDEPRLTSAATR